jgi:hypothetical protein
MSPGQQEPQSADQRNLHAEHSLPQTQEGLPEENRLPKTKQQELGEQTQSKKQAYQQAPAIKAAGKKASSRISSNILQPKLAIQNSTATGRTMTTPIRKHAYKGYTRIQY